MVATGIVRRIDDLGRVVIPKELREKIFGRRDTAGEPVEFFYKKEDDKIILILKPYEIGK